MSLALNKCKVIRFTKKKVISNYKYKLCGADLNSTESINDLGVTLDSKLHLDTHIDNIINRAFKMYGFVMRTCVAFTQLSTFLYIYKCLIRSQLEYAVSVWNPFYQKYIDAIESVQKKYLRRLSYKFGHSQHSYISLLKKYNVQTLKTRRLQLVTFLLYDIYHGKYDCIPLNNKLYYTVPHSIYVRKKKPFFAITKCRTNAGKRAPIYQMMRNYNDYFKDIDIINTRPGVFKKQVLLTTPFE